ncbi:MAG TPA: hypothetical protein VKA01_07090 [Vicinamibacteria bacterium]|nr:hypothetical protein [Vicinamibacteria bacterium]
MTRNCEVSLDGSAINDIGFRARLGLDERAARRGFRVTVGGGTCTTGSELAEFIPAGEILAVAEAIVRLFHRLGDYQHKQRNRMKFLIRSMAWEAWRAQFEGTLAEVMAAGAPRLPFDPDRPPLEEANRRAAAAARGPGAILRRRQRPHQPPPEPRPALGEDARPARPVPPDRRGGSGPSGCGLARGRDELPRSRGLPARGHAVLPTVGGGVDDERAHFGRLAAKIPVRRVPEAVDRLAALCAVERSDDETADAFFRRADLSRIKAALADLERLAPEDALPLDFVDLGDDAEFKLETQEGECSA